MKELDKTTTSRNNSHRLAIETDGPYPLLKKGKKGYAWTLVPQKGSGHVMPIRDKHRFKRFI